jgi:hypothetical protein
MTAVVQRIYCGRMTANGLCTQICIDCRPRILAAFRLEGARNAAALLTWLMKSAVAAAQEEEQGKRRLTVRRDSLGIAIPVSENPLADLAREFS